MKSKKPESVAFLTFLSLYNDNVVHFRASGSTAKLVLLRVGPTSNYMGLTRALSVDGISNGKREVTGALLEGPPIPL